jgi:hypothetical protein
MPKKDFDTACAARVYLSNFPFLLQESLVLFPLLVAREG